MADPKDPRSGPPDLPPPASDVKPVQITDEMRRSYLDYAMSVIVSRALPDARDGLKPVHRRILYTMFENGFTPDKPYKKSARVVGDVMGKYHPHGNLAIYDALVRMAQDFSMRLPLIDGQGNFGSIDNDPPAADRYTEARLDKAAMPLLDDLDKDTVKFTANYSGEFEEPSVLPAKYPNLLVNGAGGIAVGMATNIPPHNLGEVIDACTAYIDDPAISIDDLIEIVPGPDFPTGAQILGQAGARAAYHLGRGSIIMRAKWHTEEMRREREAIVFTEIPYQVNKAHLVEKIGELVREKKLEGIAELRDESDRDGIRVVVEIKRDAVVDVVLNQLYRYTALQTSFGANIVALNGGRPEVMNLKDLIRAFVDFREEVVSRRTKFLLGKARERAHVVVRPRHRRREHRRGHPAHPRRARPELGPRGAHGPRLAGAGHRAADRARRRPAPPPRRGRQLPPLRGAGAGDPRPAPAAPHRARARGGRRRADEARGRDLRLSRHPALPRPHPDHRQGRAEGGARGVRDAAPERDRRLGFGRRGRGSDPARGHGRDRVARRLHQARAALDLPGAAPRRQGPLGDADPRGGFRHPAVRRQHPHAGAVLLLARPGLQGEGLAAAARGAERQGPVPAAACCRSRRASASRRSCRCPRTRAPGTGST